MSMYTWNPNDFCFDWNRAVVGGSSPEIEDKRDLRYMCHMHTGGFFSKTGVIIDSKGN